MTELLYYIDAMQTTFSAGITKIAPDRRSLSLDRTLFYPEGGGQPGDRGAIAGIAVTDTQNVSKKPSRENERASTDEITHLLAAPLPEHFRPGDTVEGELDWAHRYEYMQQHTGQHILSGALYRVLGAATVSVHQGQDVVTIEVDRAEISEEDLQAVERDANGAIAADFSVRAFEIPHTELPRYTLRRPTDRTGMIRVVEIEHYDRVACGGVHLPRTALINVVLCVGRESIRGNLRLAFKIGDRALRDYKEKHRAATLAAELLSSRPEHLPQRVRNLQEEVQALHRTTRLQVERIARLLLPHDRGAGKPEHIVLTGEAEEVFKALAETATDRSDRRLVLINQPQEANNVDPRGPIHWAIIIGDDHPFPQDAVREHVLAPVHAKGGGKPPLWRGIIPPASNSREEQIQTFLRAFESLWS